MAARTLAGWGAWLGLALGGGALGPSALADPSASEGPVEVELERLASARATERRAAERWLAVHLQPTDFALVAGALNGAVAETRRRVSAALAADPRHLGLAVLCLTDADPPVSDTGRIAIEELILRWNAAARERPMVPGELPAFWGETATRRMSLVQGDGGVAGLVERLERLAPAPATVVLDPLLDPVLAPAGRRARRDADARISGDWGQLLTRVAADHGVVFEVFAFREPLQGARPWVRVSKRASRGETTVDLYLDWCRAVAGDSDPRRRVACARALAATGWPAALGWLEQLWLETRDEAAFEGVLLAAGRGRIVPTWTSAERVRALLTRVDRDLQSDRNGARARAEGLARALATVGAPQDWGDLLIEGWEGLRPASRWMRLVALEGQGHASESASRVLRAELATSGPTWVRSQALRALVRSAPSAGADLTLADPLPLFRDDPQRVDELVRNLVAAGVPVPAGDVIDVLDRPAERLALLEWFSTSPSDPRAVEVFLAVLRSSSLDQLAERVRLWCGLARARSVRELFDAARERLADPLQLERLARVELRAGLLTATAERERLDVLLARLPLAGEDLVDVGHLAVSEAVGWRAQEALVASVESDVSEDELEWALIQTFGALRRARLDREASALASRLRTAAGRVEHPILPLFYRPDWPPEPAPPEFELDELDRRLPPK